MTKQQISTRQTAIEDRTGKQGRQLEQTLTVDDSILPSPVELEQYKLIDPSIVSFIIDTTKKEQSFRHDFEKSRLKIFDRVGRREYMINWWGMFFAALVMFSGLALSAFLIYSDKVIIGSIFGGSTLVIAAATFMRHHVGPSNKK